MGNKSSTRRTRSSTKLKRTGSGKISKHLKKAKKSVGFQVRFKKNVKFMQFFGILYSPSKYWFTH
jgi:hypothetical protein